jgi:hypothetical protein
LRQVTSVGILHLHLVVDQLEVGDGDAVCHNEKSYQASTYLIAF